MYIGILKREIDKVNSKLFPILRINSGELAIKSIIKKRKRHKKKKKKEKKDTCSSTNNRSFMIYMQKQETLIQLSCFPYMRCRS